MQRFHAAAFRWPAGYEYRPLVIGEVLPPVFLAPDYVVDYAQYNLDPPPPGDEYVRYGSDLVVLPESSGAVDQTISDAFTEEAATTAANLF